MDRYDCPTQQSGKISCNTSGPPIFKVGFDITVVELLYGSNKPQIDPQRLYATVKRSDAVDVITSIRCGVRNNLLILH